MLANRSERLVVISTSSPQQQCDKFGAHVHACHACSSTVGFFLHKHSLSITNLPYGINMKDSP